MAAGDLKSGWAADSALTITLASLASDTNLLAGREGTAYDNSTAKDPDLFLSGKITTGTSPTVGKTIEVWVIAPIEDTPTWPDVFDGTDSAETATSRNVLASCGVLVHTIKVDATSDRTYPIRPIALAPFFGGNMPKTLVPFVVHDTGAALNATAGNHALYIQPLQPTIAQS